MTQGRQKERESICSQEGRGNLSCHIINTGLCRRRHMWLTQPCFLLRKHAEITKCTQQMEVSAKVGVFYFLFCPLNNAKICCWCKYAQCGVISKETNHLFLGPHKDPSFKNHPSVSKRFHQRTTNSFQSLKKVILVNEEVSPPTVVVNRCLNSVSWQKTTNRKLLLFRPAAVFLKLLLI